MSLHPKVPSWEVTPSTAQALPGTHAPCFLLLTASMMFQYFVKVVPTVYMKVDGEVSRGRASDKLQLVAKSFVEFLQPGE